MSMPARRVLLDLSVLEERIGYTFKKRALLVRAVTHRSFGAEHNERLEFLGDSVLNCVVGHALFLRDKHYTEGVLSRTRANFVCEKTLDEIAAEALSAWVKANSKRGAPSALRFLRTPVRRFSARCFWTAALNPRSA